MSTVNAVDLKLDGNAAGGVLQEIFAVEATTVETICGGCGTSRAVGALAVYLRAPGVVVRCPDCDTAIIRIAWRRGRYCVDASAAARFGERS